MASGCDADNCEVTTVEVIREDTLSDSFEDGADPSRVDRPLVQLLPIIRRYQREAVLLRRSVQDESARHLWEAADPYSLGFAASLDTLLPQILEGALELTGADLGTVQLLNRGSGALEIAAHAGFEAEFLEYFARVDDDSYACGRAARLRAQTVIADVEADADFRPHREIAAAAGFRAVQATPLTDHTGALVGMLSTHYRRAGRPPERTLHSARVYGRLAGQALAQALGYGTAGDIGQDGSAAPNPSFFSSGWPESADEAHIQLAQRAVHRIFSASLKLAEVQGAIESAPMRARVAAAVADLDQAIKEIQANALREY